MQLIPRYLVNNRTTIVANEAGFITEYRPVYQRQIKIYTNIDNVLEFRVLNADQKPINIGNYTPKFQAFDETNRLIIEHDGVAITGDDSAAIRGLFKVTITENDLLNVKQQYLKYSIHLVDSNNAKTLTYTDSHFGGCGSIYIDSCQYPAPAETASVTTFTEDSGLSGVDDSVWYSSTIDAQPGINGNEALHTAVVYTDSYTGNVVVQATLDNSIIGSGTVAWADVASVSFTGNENEPTPINFNGVYSHLRFKTTASPANTISKILVRN